MNCEHRKDGLCKKCYSKQWYQKNKEKRDKQIKEWKKANPDKMRKVYNRSRGKRAYQEAARAAKGRQLDFLLTEQQYDSLVIEPCTYCGDSLGDTGTRLDRIDNDRGYVVGNVLPCCGRCNLLRSHKLSVEEMRVGMKALREYWRQNDTKS